MNNNLQSNLPLTFGVKFAFHLFAKDGTGATTEMGKMKTGGE